MNTAKLDPTLLQELKWRCIGPPRGGRVAAVSGHPTEPMVFYFGACAGGVWKTIDGGTYWENISDGYFNSAAIGALAIGVIPSPWLYATTAAGALFIVLGRRYAEVRLAGDDALDQQAPAQRSVLSSYSGPFIGQLLTISATAAWLSYTLYTVEAPTLPQNGAMLLTVPLVTVGLFRYLYLLNTSKDAESPEHLIIKDLPMILSIVTWIAGSAVVLLWAA